MPKHRNTELIRFPSRFQMNCPIFHCDSTMSSLGFRSYLIAMRSFGLGVRDYPCAFLTLKESLEPWQQNRNSRTMSAILGVHPHPSSQPSLHSCCFQSGSESSRRSPSVDSGWADSRQLSLQLSSCMLVRGSEVCWSLCPGRDAETSSGLSLLNITF